VKGATRFFLRQVEPGLASDAAVHLGEKRRRDLDERNAAEERGGGEPGEIADHPPAKATTRESLPAFPSARNS
jgi:hypothetical protein